MKCEFSFNLDGCTSELHIVFQCFIIRSGQEEHDAIAFRISNKKPWRHTSAETADGTGTMHLAGRGAHYAEIAFCIDKFAKKSGHVLVARPDVRLPVAHRDRGS